MYDRYLLEKERPRENYVTSYLANVYGLRMARTWWKYASRFFLIAVYKQVESC